MGANEAAVRITYMLSIVAISVATIKGIVSVTTKGR